MTAQPGLKIVVEGPEDARIIRAIAGQELAPRLRVFASQGLASLATVGRNVLFHEGGPVLLVMDSNTLDPRLAAELRSMNRAALSGVVTSGGPIPQPSDSPPESFQVFTFVPAIEVVFFETPQALDHMLGRKTPPEKVREGRLLPKQTLSELLESAHAHRDYRSLLADMDPQVRHAIASGRQAKALKATIEAMLVTPAKV